MKNSGGIDSLWVVSVWEYGAGEEAISRQEYDLRRFHVYDAYTELHYKKSVTTYVICSGKVWSVHSVLIGDLNTYRIIPLRMKQAEFIL